MDPGSTEKTPLVAAAAPLPNAVAGSPASSVPFASTGLILHDDEDPTNDVGGKTPAPSPVYTPGSTGWGADTPTTPGIEPQLVVPQAFIIPADPRVDVSKRYWHWRSLFATIALFGIAATTGWCMTNHNYQSQYGLTQVDEGCAGTGSIGVKIGFGVIYVLYLIEFFCSDTLKFLRNVHTVETAEAYAQRLHAVAPVPVQWIRCYHYETRITYVTHRRSDGSSYTETRTERVEVTTYRESQNFRFDAWRDVSQPFPIIHFFRMTKLHNGKSLAFANEFTRAKFDYAMNELISRNRFRDTHMDSGWRLEVPGFKSHLLAFIDLSTQSCMMTWPAYTLVTLLGFTWPYRIWLEQRCVRAQYRFVKEVFCGA